MHPGSRPQSPPTDYRDQPNRARPSNRRISQSRPKRPLSSPRPPPTVGIPGSPLGPGYPPGTFPDTGPPSSSIDIKGANVDVDRTFSGQTQRLAAEEQQASHPAAAFNQSWPESDASGGGAREAVPALKSPGPKQAEFHQPPPPPSSSTSTLSTRSSEKLLKLFRRSSVLSTDTLVNSKEAAPGPAENSGGSTFLGRIHQRSDSTSSYGTLASSPRLPTSPSISTGDLSANAKRQPSLLKKASYNSFKSRDTQYSQQALPTEDAVRPGPISTSSSPLTRMTKTKSEQGERGSSSWRMGFSKRSASAQQQQQQPQQQLLAEAEQSHLQGSKKTANPWDRQAAARAGRQVSDSKLMGLLDSQDGKDRASFRAASMSEGLGALGSPSSRFRDPSSGSGSLGGKRSKLERLMGGDVPPPTEPSSNASVRGLPDHSSDFKPSTSSAQHPHTGSRGLHHNASSGTIGNASSNGTFGEDSRYKSSFATSRTRGESERSSPVTGWADLGEADCPVCLEPLSYRLAGEKPHVMPTCGHALHNACFTAVYGPTEAVLATQSQDMGAGSSRPRNTGNPPGMCGVCRRPIVLGGDDASGKGASEYIVASSYWKVLGSSGRPVSAGPGPFSCGRCCVSLSSDQGQCLCTNAYKESQTEVKVNFRVLPGNFCDGTCGQK